MNTGLKKSIFDDWYSVTSSHAHTTFPSIMQNDNSNFENSKSIIYIGLMQGVFMNSFFIKDFSKIYSTVFEMYNSSDSELINNIEFCNTKGRNLI